MSTQPAMPLAPALLAVGQSSRAASRLSINGLSINGFLLFVMSLSVVASAFPQMRPIVMGLAVHPYLIVVGLALPLAVMARIHLFPVRVLAALVLFVGMYCFSVLNGGHNQVGEVVKIGSAFATIITSALLVRRRGDFVAGALGLSIAIAVLAIRALDAPVRADGINAMAGMANKNSYSLFALPAVLLAGYIVLNLKIPVVFKTIFVGTTVPTLVAIFLSGNRSGWLGAVLVGVMLFWNRRGKGFLLVCVLAAIVGFWIVKFGSTGALQERVQKTVEGYQSDTLRRNLVVICLEIGLENPLIGVGPQMLSLEIGRRSITDYNVGVNEAHNVFAHVLGGSGVFCFAALLGVGWCLWTWKPRGGGKVGGREDPLHEARKLMRMLVFLWVVRGMFTSEIQFNPSFNIAFGLGIGFCMLAEVARSGEPAVSSKPSPQSGQARLATGH